MTTAFPHAHVSYVSRNGRRRSQSLTTPNSVDEDAPEQSIQQKQFLAQLQKERQKQQNNRDGRDEEQYESRGEHQKDEEDDHQSTVTRTPRANTSMSKKKHTSSTMKISVQSKNQMSSTTGNTPAAQEDEQHQPVVTRTVPSTTTMSFKNHPSSTASFSTSVKKDISSSTTSRTTNIQDDEQHHEYQSQVIRIPRSESTTSLKKKISTVTRKDSNLDSSQISSNHLLISPKNLMTKSEIFDQEFYLNDSKDHARRNDVKDHGSIKISERKKYYTDHNGKLPTRSSASCMASIIAIIIAIIAFAFGLTAFILVLLLRSTVNASLGLNSTASNSSSSGSSSSGGNGSLPSACSAYITLDDPTRSVYAAGYALGCDNTAPFINRTYPVWIRFIGTGGTTLPLTTPGINLCGSVGTGWYDGTMPSSTGEIVNGTACFTWTYSVCQYSCSISVANCDSFYIYLLPPPPVCMARYCTI